MVKELNENTGFHISVKTLIGIGTAMATVISMWFMLQLDIKEAKELPVPPPSDVSRMEYTLKDEMIRGAIFQTQKDLDEMKETIKRLEDKIDRLR